MKRLLPLKSPLQHTNSTTVLLLLLLLLIQPCQSRRGDERSVQILNESGSRVELYWVHANTGELVIQSTPFIYNGASFHLSSFVSHKFEVRQLPHAKSGKCSHGKCRSSYFVVNENNDQVVFIKKGMELLHQDEKTLARQSAMDAIASCQDAAKSALTPTSSSQLTHDHVAQTYDQLISCVEANVADKIQKANQDVAFQSKLRNRMGDLVEEYTCKDQALETTTKVESKAWAHRGTRREVDVLFDRDTSTIHLIKDFVSPEECRLMEEEAKKTMHRTHVWQEGGSRSGKDGEEEEGEETKKLKALQGRVQIPWDKLRENHPLALVGKRIFDYARHVSDLQLEELGQEDLAFINYVGKTSDEKDETDQDQDYDRFDSHCDGACHGLPHKPGGRMATFILHCGAPIKGGALHFRNAGAAVVPKVGEAVFVSYMGPDETMDKGFSEYTTCPVVEGERKDVVQWIRYGVSEEMPWNSFQKEL